MSDSSIRYDQLTQRALRSVVRWALQRALEEGGLPGEHHFFITFRTGFPGVVLPERLRRRYPDEMTIVIKRHYWDLDVLEDRFHVGLSFDQEPTPIAVPFASITQFVDPSVSFGLRFDVQVPLKTVDSRSEAGLFRGNPGSAGGTTPVPEAARVLQIEPQESQATEGVSEFPVPEAGHAENAKEADADTTSTPAAATDAPKPTSPSDDEGQVVSLDAFRRKHPTPPT